MTSSKGDSTASGARTEKVSQRPISLAASASAPSADCGAVIAMAGPIIVLSLSIEPDTKPPRARAEGGFATFKDVADGLADHGVFQSTRHVADRRQAA